MPRNKPQRVPPIYQPELAADLLGGASDGAVYVGGSTITIPSDMLAASIGDLYLARRLPHSRATSPRSRIGLTTSSNPSRTSASIHRRTRAACSSGRRSTGVGSSPAPPWRRGHSLGTARPVGANGVLELA